jgi:hydrophobic/amphiphilic exporter-1 (mainly G- bacteria), HAE1 family
MIRLSIRRPVAVTMAYMALALLGVSAWQNIPVERLPSVAFPQLTVSFTWRGASPETVEAYATSPIEAAIQQLRWVERITSDSRENSATITVQFARDADMDLVRLELSERLAVVEEQMPPGVGTIVVRPYIPRAFAEQATAPVLRYTFTGPFLLESLYGHVQGVIVPELSQIPGVAAVEVNGGRERLLEMEVDPDRIAALGLTPQRIHQAIQSLDLVREAGAIRDGDRQYTLTVRNRPGDAQALRDAVLLTAGGVPIRLDEVANIRDTFEEITSHYRINGAPALSFQVHRERGANTIRVAEQARATVAALEPLNPPGARTVLMFDQSTDIRRDFLDLRNRAFFAAIVIIIVLLGFLRSWRTAGVIFMTIAFSILISLNLLYFTGLTLNLLTLLGLALGFGLIVDNAIVVLENIFRKWQEGLPAEEAAEKGARDVTLPILASTATTLIVFAPFVYFQGELAVYYLPLAFVVALTLLASLFVAFTFIPSVAARILRRRERQGRRPPPHPATAGEADSGDARVPFYHRFYSGLLGVTLRFPWATVMVAALCFYGTYRLFDENVPRGQQWSGFGGATRSWVDVNITMPRGADLERVDELVHFFEERLALMPEVSEFTANVSGTTGRLRVEFPEELEFTAVPLIIEDELRAFSLGFTGANVRVFGQGPSFGVGGGGSTPNYRVTLLGYNYERLGEIADDLGRRLEQHTRIREVNTNASGAWGSDRASEFAVYIDRLAAAQHGFSVEDVSSMIHASVRAPGATGSTKIGGEDVDYEIKLAGYRRLDVLGLLDHVVVSPRGTEIRLGDLVDIDERYVLSSIRRENQQYERTVAYEFRGPTALGNVINQAAIDATVLPAGYSIRDRTEWRLSSDDRRQLRTVLLIAIGLVFMVTAGIFESIRQPLCVLLAVPMALIGVFVTFVYVRASFTPQAEIGVIMMGGIVVNNAILLVDHINRVRRENVLALKDAIVRATLERVRPILMTTATTVFGLLPLVMFTRGVDSTIWGSLTYSLIGGLLASTIFVLTTTPALYLLFERGEEEKVEVEEKELVPALG